MAHDTAAPPTIEELQELRNQQPQHMLPAAFERAHDEAEGDDEGELPERFDQCD